MLFPAVFYSLAPALAAVVGLCVGSFYNVCIARYLSGESIVFPGSKCPVCGHRLRWWENIPLLSFVLLRGRCRGCQGNIHWRYPVVEALNGLWAFLLIHKFPLLPGAEMEWLALWSGYMLIGGILIIVSFIDLELYILPDVYVYPGILLTLAFAFFVVEPFHGAPTFKEALYGAGIGAGVFLALQRLYRLLKGHEGLGTGDIKLMLILGALVGWQGLPMMILVSAFSALLVSAVYMRRQQQGMQTMVPFGPFLSLGAMVYVVAGDLYWELVR
ncbi:prepilin peptidase [Megalodesulfovibrio gigas]|uniref:prepilin peptidase n=1 Tax=Megalodesulfovibrio gigas TaxID=879 RepID=UPI0004104FCA|nr:A24 family peptidase [Megalodesulfovibrio gigas]